MTKPIFIVGSGRSGTRTFFRMLTGADNVEIHHEYNVLEVQRLGVLYKNKLINKKEALAKLDEIYTPAIDYSDAKVWLDSSNKCSWIIDLLSELYPEAKFLSVVRDGRKVVASFYYKLREEMYDDRSNAVMMNFLSNKEAKPLMPPLEKKYWWYVPFEDQVEFERFRTYNRFQRVCFHWKTVNTVIMEQASGLSGDKFLCTKLEQVTKSATELQAVCDFLEIENDPIYSEYLKTPECVLSAGLSADQGAANGVSGYLRTNNESSGL